MRLCLGVTIPNIVIVKFLYHIMHDWNRLVIVLLGNDQANCSSFIVFPLVFQSDIWCMYSKNTFPLNDLSIWNFTIHSNWKLFLEHNQWFVYLLFSGWRSTSSLYIFEYIYTIVTRLIQIEWYYLHQISKNIFLSWSQQKIICMFE